MPGFPGMKGHRVSDPKHNPNPNIIFVGLVDIIYKRTKYLYF